MSLAYPVEITKIAQVEGGGYLARIPLLKGCLSDGETVEEALIYIEEAKREWLAATLKIRHIIPAPVDESWYSDKFTLRLPQFCIKSWLRMPERLGHQVILP